MAVCLHFSHVISLAKVDDVFVHKYFETFWRWNRAPKLCFFTLSLAITLIIVYLSLVVCLARLVFCQRAQMPATRVIKAHFWALLSQKCLKIACNVSICNLLAHLLNNTFFLNCKILLSWLLLIHNSFFSFSSLQHSFFYSLTFLNA